MSRFAVGERGQVDAYQGFSRDVSHLAINSYDDISDVYGLVMGNDYAVISYGLYRELFESRGQSFRLLDLGCGTGAFLHQVAMNHKLHGVGVDLSSGQLRAARKRFGGEDCCSDITLIQSDIAKISLDEKFDFVTMNLDALNHVRSIDDWVEVLLNAYNCLKKYGVLVFDVNTGNRLIHDWSIPEVLVGDDYTYVQTGLWGGMEDGVARRAIHMMIHVRAEKAAGNSLDWESREALIEQVCPSADWIRGCLGKHGFRSIKVSRAEDVVGPRHLFSRNRLYFSAIK